MGGRQLDPVDGRDVVGSAPADGLWSRVSPRRRSLALVATGVLLAAVVVGYALDAGRSWLREQDLDDSVSLSAELTVSAVSNTGSGGRVDFSVTLANTAARPVVVSAVDVVDPRLRITDELAGAGAGTVELAPDGVARLPLSVVLDCRPGASAPAGQLVAQVQAEPPNGRRRSVDVELVNSVLVTDIADTLCALDPGRHDDELDGPVATPAVG